MLVEQLKTKALTEISRRKKELVRLCSELIQIPSENPPGDTKEISEFVLGYLEERGARPKKYEPKDGLVNVVCIHGTNHRPSLVLNGHLDVFPAGDQGWTFPPFSGEVRDGRILGRGSTDMKAGVAASLFAYTVISELGVRLPGKLVLALVADEESGGKWGTEWLVNNVPDVRGDACLIAEPGGTSSIVLGEKGRCQIRVKTTGVAGHSPMPIHTENAITKMAQLIPIVNGMKKLTFPVPAELREVIARNKILYDRKIGKGAGDVLDHLTVNVGMIRGGRNINTVPSECEIDVDVTLPFGVSPEQILKDLESKLNSTGMQNVSCQFIEEYPFHRPALYTPMTERIARLTYENAEAVTGSTPTFFIKHWGTDGKFFRKLGIPTITYGTSEMTAEPNESVDVNELCTVAKVHAGTILDFLFRVKN